MAQSSVGFNGTVNEIQWAKLAPFIGQDDVGDAAAVAGVTQVPGFRRVLVPAGVVTGWGVQTTLSAAESPAADMPAPAAGQWHLLVLRRVWATKATSLLTIPHTTTTNVAQTAPPTTYPAAMLANPGVQDDVPYAWLWVNVTTTNVAIWPILKPTNTARILALEGNAQPAGTTAQRDAYWNTPAGIPADATAGRALQDKGASWRNASTGFTEEYFALYNVTTNPLGAVTAGWWPISLRPAVSSQIISSGNWTIASAFATVSNKWATLTVICNRTAGTIAAGAAENIASIGADLLPAATVSCAGGLFGTSTPFACFAQISTAGFITIFSPAGAPVQNTATVSVSYRVP